MSAECCVLIGQYLTGVVQEIVDTVELGLENTMLEQEPDLVNMSPDCATTSAASNRACDWLKL